MHVIPGGMVTSICICACGWSLSLIVFNSGEYQTIDLTTFGKTAAPVAESSLLDGFDLREVTLFDHGRRRVKPGSAGIKSAGFPDPNGYRVGVVFSRARLSTTTHGHHDHTRHRP
jgi:hypothetical protein